MNDADRIKLNVLLLVVSVAAGAALTWWFARQPAPKAKPQVTIQDGQTIDFSSGRPVIRNSKSDKAIIDAAVKEMDEAARNVRFKPTASKPSAAQQKQSGAAGTAPETKQ